MLKVYIPPMEFFDPSKNEFLNVEGTSLSLEHSLVSISKWESKWKKPFLSTEDKSKEETIDYIKCMTITQNVNPLVYAAITPKIIASVNDYIGDEMSATTFSDNGPGKTKTKSRKTVTSELLYYYMFSLGIPKDCEKWHLNRLLNLIRIFQAENNKQNMSKKDLYRQNRELNAKRKAALHSRG